MKTTRFASLLRHSIEGGHYRLTDLAKKTNLHASDLSKIVNGRRGCSPKIMAVIVGGLLEHHQSQALVAWLVDQIPPNFQHLVNVVKTDSSAKAGEPPDVNTLEGALALLATQAEANTAVRKLVLTMAQAFNGKD
jgi:hypothetical protein